MNETVRKEIRLPIKTVQDLEKLAAIDQRKLKPYMEKVLRDHAEKPKK
jgi:hypothetical protein